VIAHIASAVVPESRLNVYEEQLRESEAPAYAGAPGLISVRWLHRRFVAYVELMTISTWQTEEALKLFLDSQPTLEDIRKNQGVIQLERRTYEIFMSLKGKHQDSESVQLD
jgi:heme-degrading monooxygenase HmoA